MVPYKTEPGKTPRKIKIERKKRLFLEQDIEELLLREGLDYSLMKDSRLDAYLPLEMFDDITYDPRTPEEWQSLGVCKVNKK